MKLYAVMFAAAQALRASRRLCSPRRAVTLGRQRVGASDEERRVREAQAPLIAEQWEYGEEPFDDQTGEDDVGFALVSASASAAQVAAGVRALAPYVSPERKAAFVKVAGQRTAHLRVAFERPSNPANAWACLRTIDAFGVQDVDVVKDLSLIHI